MSLYQFFYTLLIFYNNVYFNEFIHKFFIISTNAMVGRPG